VQIQINDKKLKAALEDDRLCQRKFGKPMAKFIRLRMDALHAARSLHDFWPAKSKPERVHEVPSYGKRVFSIDLQQPYRLLFKAHEDNEDQDGTTEDRWRMIKKITILSVEDTHG
jgi:plasmid maintenance system killer protein